MPAKRGISALSFSAPAWRLAARDRWIGWDDTTRQSGLGKIVGNSRFLILPTVRVPNLASHVLSQALRRLAQDWQTRYGISPVLVETFVDRSRYAGICYKAAYRFLDHDETTQDTLLQPHFQATAARIQTERVVLAVQDTTSLNYTTHKATEGIGAIGTTVDGSQGLHLHSPSTPTARRWGL